MEKLIYKTNNNSKTIIIWLMIMKRKIRLMRITMTILIINLITPYAKTVHAMVWMVMPPGHAMI